MMNASTQRRTRTGGAWRRRALLVSALVGVGAISACLFEARTPEPPVSTGGPLITLDAPERVFAAISASFEQLAAADYERALSAQFAFYPLLDDSLDQNLIGTGVYVDWTKDVELDVLRQIILAEASSIEVEWSYSALINENTFVRWDADYVLTVVASAAGDTTVYGGNSQIDVFNEGGNWRIQRWKDISAAADVRTWGYLRGISRLRLQ